VQSKVSTRAGIMQMSNRRIIEAVTSSCCLQATGTTMPASSRLSEAHHMEQVATEIEVGGLQDSTVRNLLQPQGDVLLHIMCNCSLVEVMHSCCCNRDIGGRCCAGACRCCFRVSSSTCCADACINCTKSPPDAVLPLPSLFNNHLCSSRPPRLLRKRAS
jgi:hypothetical protein